MKNLFNTIYALFLIVIICSTGCSSDDDDDKSSLIEKPTATFEAEGDKFTSTTGEYFILIAKPTPEEKIVNEWYVDGVLEGTSTTLKYKFTTPGTKKVEYHVRNEAGEFIKEFTVEVSDVLIVNLSIGDVNSIDRHQGDELEIIALVSAGVGIKHQWEIDGVIVSTDHILDGFILSENKTYKVKYTAVHSTRTYVKEFTVKILGLPLEVDFTVKDKTQTRLKGKTLDILATVTEGAEGAKHTWKVNGTVVSETSELSYLCAEEGKFEITYDCINAQGDTFSYNWTLNVVVGSFMHDRFENGFREIMYKGGNANAIVEIVSNPLKEGLNVSDNVLKVSKSFVSQQLNVYIKRATPALDITNEIWNKGFDRVRFLYYNPATSGRKVTWKFNGVDPILEITPQPLFGQWSYVDIELTNTQMNSLTQLNLRLNDGTGNSDNDVVYIDDLEFYNSELMK